MDAARLPSPACGRGAGGEGLLIFVHAVTCIRRNARWLLRPTLQLRHNVPPVDVTPAEGRVQW